MKGVVFMCIKQVECGRGISFAAVIMELSFLCLSSVATPYERGLNQGVNGQSRRNKIFQQSQRKAKANPYNLYELQQCSSNSKHLNPCCPYLLSLCYNFWRNNDDCIYCETMCFSYSFLQESFELHHFF